MRYRLTARIFFKLISGIVCVMLVALVAADWLANSVVQRTTLATLTREAEGKARVLALTGNGGKSDIRELARAAEARITRIDRTGRVLADSEAPAEQMENHAYRPEVRAALAGRAGSHSRTSATVGMNFLYVAVPLADGGALRLATPLREIDKQVQSVTRQVLVAIVLAFIFAALVAALIARYVSRKMAGIIDHAGKLARGDFDSRLPVSRGDELDILAQQLNTTGERLKRMVVELNAEHEKLDRVERVRRDFIINVSHELRTPLASIQGYTETLLDGALDDPHHNVRFLNIIRSNAERLGRLIADLMTLSQIELKRTKFEFERCSVKELIIGCRDSILPMATKKGITLEVSLAPEDAEAECDPEAVHQIITNLLDNAIKYTARGGSVKVSAVPTSEGMKVSVRDTGIGIPNEDQPRLFERFYRVDKARSREMGGTGLGLAIVKHLVLAHNGRVWVESEPGKGSTFSFIIPERTEETSSSTGLNLSLTEL
jgi:two-component system phosphate regulon sensor histidine kinase PhoR